MEEVKVCRICLAMDVKMFDLQSHLLNTYFISIAGNNLLTIKNSPPYACYECVALVKKFYHFRQKCHKSQDLLSSLIDHNKKITVSKLKQIDRQGLGLCSNLNTYFVPGSSVDKFLRPEIIIKTEPSIDNGEIDLDSLSSEMIIEDEPNTKNIDFNPGINSLVPEIVIEKEPVTEDTVSDTKNKSVNPEVLFIEAPIVQNADYPILNQLINAPPLGMTIRKEPLSRNFRSNVTINSLASEVIESILGQSRKPEIPIENGSNYSPDPLHTEVIIKNEPIIESNEYGVDGEDGKEEDYGSPERFNSSDDDDVPIQFFKKKKIALTQKKDNEDANDDVDMPEETQSVRMRTKKSRRKVGDELEDNFTVTELTLKQQKEELNKRKMSSNYLNSHFKCEYCLKGFIDAVTWEAHHKQHWPVKRGEIQEDGIYCEECDRNFDSLTAYIRHAAGSSEHSRNLNECPTCFETFKDQKGMETHYRMVHPEKPRGKEPPQPKLKWPTKCEHCPELLQNSRAHLYHYRRKHPDKKHVLKRHVCYICDKCFKYNSMLQDHKRTHTGERPYKCKQCGKAYGKMSNLRLHEKCHSNVYPYLCHLCPKTFEYHSSLNKHLVYHNKKPFQCDICSKAFTTAGHRKAHVDTVHLGRPRSS